MPLPLPLSLLLPLLVLAADSASSGAASDEQKRQIGLLVADSSDNAALNTIAASTKAIRSTAGPFLLLGEGVVRACAENGTHYCDITGESQFLKDMARKYGDKARETGAVC